MHDHCRIKTLDLYSDVSLSFIGPDLEEGPLPALFYFALAAHESLGVDPYNQPAVYLSTLPIRIFSIDVPSHGIHLSSKEALKEWVKHFLQGENILVHCAKRVSTIIADLIEKNVIQQEKCALAGLSRGALLAALVAAHFKEAQWILGFAPLTDLSVISEFKEMADTPLLRDLNMENLIPALIDRTLRFYIGNCDQRVSTRKCFDFIEKLSLTMHEAHIRSPRVELFIKPSIGFQGHGTSKETFHHGAQWIAHQLGIIDVC